ncbi:hypothetical protein P153DRAFT_396059 [Dothidotthia symphoricarpi CBS 119687]|uniref:DUF7580 domain-containing protein n=1 Tax=Dothidotthia symphoricarpi CBS 119687 TaxID=1392245 RepID=A0A6A6AFC4_9PLEO|nr:uncharacterized protein P153DRAFT_396059 [Dothidotthia symphoricarpi CBS 119687]KAF2130672.1 hypothetical protein P153DRAFT_396059 [Dothidotthia symphoricarpi CBS 119687]
MSGLEIAGVLLGAFPLIISGLEHWRDVAKVGGFFWRIRNEYKACRREVQFHEILYKRNLRELLLPITDDAVQVTCLISDPGGKGWGSEVLQERLKGRLLESYNLYMEIICEMNRTVEELREELALDKTTVQGKLGLPNATKQRTPSSPQAHGKTSKLESAKVKWDFEKFRLKFSFNEPVRHEIFERLKECNGRLEQLLSTSDKILALENAALPDTKHTSALETVVHKVRKKSDVLFNAIQAAWQCSCQQYHFANLRLEHHTLPDISFEVIFTFITPSPQVDVLWSWRELQCEQMINCSFSQTRNTPPTISEPCQPSSNHTPVQRQSPRPAKQKTVTLITSTHTIPKLELDILVDPNIELCQLLGNEEQSKCMGVIRRDDAMYHLHPISKRKRPDDDRPLTLNHILSRNFDGHLTRRQRYSVALLLASSVAQLQFTPWLQKSLTKDDVLFFPSLDDEDNIPHQEPFLRQGFSPQHSTTTSTKANDCDFISLGILLLELCFGQRLEDHPLRKKYAVEVEGSKDAFDLMAALKWCQSVTDEGGDDYASAVKWCFVAGARAGNDSWRMLGSSSRSGRLMTYQAANPAKNTMFAR